MSPSTKRRSRGNWLLGGSDFGQFKRLNITYKGAHVGTYEADFVVQDEIVLEIKAVSGVHPAHEAQALNYLAATGLRLAIVLNFGGGSLEYKRLVK